MSFSWEPFGRAREGSSGSEPVSEGAPTPEEVSAPGAAAAPAAADAAASPVGSSPRVGPNGSQLPDTYRASCWSAIDWNDMRCSGETPWRPIAARCSGVE